MRKPDLLVLVAVWDFVVAFFLLIGIAAIAIFAFPAVYFDLYGMDLNAAVFGLIIGLVVLLILMAVALAAGIGLLQNKNWGRVMSIVVAAAGLFSVPIGTVIGILIIVYLNRPDVRDYFLPRVP